MVTLSTKDNPYNPFTQFDEWNAFDIRKGYHTCSYLDRISYTSPYLPPADYEQAIEDAVDEAIKYDPLGIYVKVKYNPPGGG